MRESAATSMVQPLWVTAFTVLPAMRKPGPMLFASCDGREPRAWVWNSNFIPGSRNAGPVVGCGRFQEVLTLLGNWECYDPKDELMWGAKEDRGWSWVTLGEWRPDASKGKTEIRAQGTFLSELVGLCFCFRFICVDLWWDSNEACDLCTGQSPEACPLL